MRSRGRPEVASCRIFSGGVGIHTWTAGEGDPVVLVHGFGVSGRYMLPLAEALARWFSVFVPELPGNGRSEKPPTPLANRYAATEAPASATVKPRRVSITGTNVANVSDASVRNTTIA